MHGIGPEPGGEFLVHVHDSNASIGPRSRNGVSSLSYILVLLFHEGE